METRGFVVEWSGASGEMTIWASTQVPHELRLFCSRLLGVPEQRIRVVMRDTGGGFGQKALVLREEMSLMLAARLIPAPIKWIEDRRENLMSAGQSRHEHATARMALDRDGSLLAATVDHVQDVGAYPTPWPVGTAAAVGMLFPGPYRIPRATFTSKAVLSNTVGRTAYRGPWQFESVAREVLLDIAARQLAIDPIELRRRNLLRRDELPYSNATGFVYDSGLMDADHPYILAVDEQPGAATIVELPGHWALDDWEAYNYLPGITGSGVISNPADVLARWTLELEALVDEGGLFMLTNHPFVSGRASRAVALERLIERAQAIDGLWIATAAEIAAHAASLGLEPVVHRRPAPID